MDVKQGEIIFRFKKGKGTVLKITSKGEIFLKNKLLAQDDDLLQTVEFAFLSKQVTNFMNDMWGIDTNEKNNN